MPTLLLTTTGRRTGQTRTSPLIFGRDGDDYLIVASMGGAPEHPQWYLNLTANPDAEIQVQGRAPPGHRPHRVGGREAPPVGHRDRSLAQLRRLPEPNRAEHPRRRAQPQVTRRPRLFRRDRGAGEPTSRDSIGSRGPPRRNRVLAHRPGRTGAGLHVGLAGPPFEPTGWGPGRPRPGLRGPPRDRSADSPPIHAQRLRRVEGGSRARSGPLGPPRLGAGTLSWPSSSPASI